MTWLNTAAAWWLLLVPALLLIYMLRARPVRKAVPSLRLWQALPQEERTRSRLRRPPLSLLLLLQAILLVVGAFALMQPALTAPLGRHMVILLDASGSMQAADGNATRFDEARAQAHRLALGLGSEEDARLLRVGPGMTTLCSSCGQAALNRAIQTAHVGAGQANWGPALDTAAGLARRTGEGAGQIVVISDGAFDALDTSAVPASIHFVQVGQQADDLGIAALSARKPPDGTPNYTAYARIVDTGFSQEDVQVEALADTVPLGARRLSLPAGGHADLTWQLPVGTAKFTVRLDASDALAADNEAVIFLPGAAQHSVAIQSEQPGVYTRALDSIPGLQPASGSSGGPVAFTIIEGSIPLTLPKGSLLLVNPDGPLVPSTGTMENVQPLDSPAGNPLLSGVDLGALMIDKARRIDTPQWLEPVVQASDGPLLLTGERNGQRIAVLAFDPSESNLPKLASFPILISNIANWLYPLAQTEALRPGEPVYLAPGTQVIVPSGKVAQVPQSGVLADTEEAGVYKVEAPGSKTPVSFAVNMADTQESDLTSRPHPELDRPAPDLPAARVTSQQFWPPLAALALALVGLEWLFYCWKRGRT